MSWLLALAVIAIVGVAAFFFGRRYLANRGPRLVECPDNHQPASVTVRAAAAAWGGSLQLDRCSRWPEKASCGRECLSQIERSPDGCLVRTMVTDWYADKSCSVCHQPIGRVDWFERKPGLMDAAGRVRQWQEVAPEMLPSVLSNHVPVCFDCCVSETFRRQHPELVLENPWRRAN